MLCTYITHGLPVGQIFVLAYKIHKSHNLHVTKEVIDMNNVLQCTCVINIMFAIFCCKHNGHVDFVTDVTGDF